MDIQEIVNGVAEDPRSEEEKSRDFPHEDFLGGAITVPEWKYKEWSELTHLTKRDQAYSYSCGAQALAKCIEFFTGKVESATPTYRARANFPNGGMYIQDIGKVGKKKKTTTEELCKSQYMSESEMNSAIIPSDLPDGISGYYSIPVDAEYMATALERGDCVILLVRSHHSEYTDTPFNSGKEPDFGHFVSIVDKNYMLWNGEKAFLIDESASIGSTYKVSGTPSGQRIFTESFIKARCIAALGLIKAVETPKKYSHKFPDGLRLKKGSTGEEVKALQNILVIEGLLKPSCITGYFGPITFSAVKALQDKYRDQILVPARLSNPTGEAGKYTLSFLNSKYV